MKFYRNERIEEIAEQRLREFEGKLGRPLSIPIDIELFGDLVLGLSMLWEDIDELPGEEVLAGLRPADRLIVMNERRKLELEQQAGRRRLPKAMRWDTGIYLSISRSLTILHCSPTPRLPCLHTAVRREDKFRS
jgi:hypothetical protein